MRTPTSKCRIDLNDFDWFVDDEAIRGQINFIFHHLPESLQFLVSGIRISSDLLDEFVQIFVICPAIANSFQRSSVEFD